MRSMMGYLAAGLVAVGLLHPLSAQAQDIFDGGRSAGGSSQLVPPGSTLGAGELLEAQAVDVDRYMGTWYQVAAVPQPYTLQCASNTTAEYARLNDTTIAVRNSCHTVVGGRSTIEGTAVTRSPSSLRVSFPGVSFQNPAGPPNYRVTYLAEDYSWAVVGSPNRLSGFVLSRSPALSPDQWRQVRDVVSARGWHACTFLTVPMEGGRQDVAPVCAL